MCRRHFFIGRTNRINIQKMKGICERMDTEFQVIAKNIKFLRERMGYTQEQLAEATDLSVSHLSKVESGQRRIGMRAYISILQVLGATEEEVISTTVDGETESGFKQYQSIMRGCNEAEKKFLLDTLEILKLNMKELICGNCPMGV